VLFRSLVTVQPRGEHLAVALVNDSSQEWTGTMTLALRSFDGSVLHHEEQAAHVPAWSSRETAVPSRFASPSAPERCLLEARVGDRRAFWFFTEDRDGDLSAPEFDAKASKTSTGFQVTLTAGTLIRDAALLVDKVDPTAVVSDMLTTILPGETVTWAVESGSSADPELLLAPTILRSANQLLSRR